ncbi:MAG: hypothetical protein J6E46_09485 [Faecalicoccus sp.]|nr:hypothetical protein [Faecalicoccus sp.]
MNNKRNYWKGYLICMPLLLGAIAATGKLDTWTAISITVGFLVMAIGSFTLSRRKLQ